MEISKELLSEVLSYKLSYKIKVHKIIVRTGTLNYFYNIKDSYGGLFEANAYINVYELAHKNLKQWAKLKNVFDIIDWSGEPEQILSKAEEIRKVNEKQLRH